MNIFCANRLPLWFIKSLLVILCTFILCDISACTSTNDVVEHAPVEDFVSHGAGPSGQSSEEPDDDSTQTSLSELDVDAIFNEFTQYLKFEELQSMSIVRGSAKYTVDTYYISAKEVTQEFYKTIMGKIPNQDKNDALLPVVNVSWYDVVLFCNALSKKVGLDTAYIYESIGNKNYLKNLVIDYSHASVRLPTETEWELAARGGTTTRFYWEAAVASDYAYYGQSKGPERVGMLKPNAYKLYDMAGNVAEWVNDWYSSYSTTSQKNPIGPKTGSTKCVRGGGWSDKVSNIAPSERNKKDPMYKGMTVGFRIVYSRGF